MKAAPTISTFSVTKGGKIEETYAYFQNWHFDLDLDQNLDRMVEDNVIVAPTAAWLKEMRRIFHVRFADFEIHQPLVKLASRGFPLDQWSPLLLWHLCYRELLLSDFLENWVYVRREDGYLRVRPDDVRLYLKELTPRGLLTRDWSANTIGRMASGLPSYAADFGILQGKGVKEIAPFYMPDDSLLYILHAMHEEGLTTREILDDARWRRFLMSGVELERELLRLHQHRKLTFEVAGSLVALHLPCSTVGEYVDQLLD